MWYRKKVNLEKNKYLICLEGTFFSSKSKKKEAGIRLAILFYKRVKVNYKVVHQF